MAPCGGARRTGPVSSCRARRGGREPHRTPTPRTDVMTPIQKIQQRARHRRPRGRAGYGPGGARRRPPPPARRPRRRGQDHRRPRGVLPPRPRHRARRRRRPLLGEQAHRLVRSAARAQAGLPRGVLLSGAAGGGHARGPRALHQRAQPHARERAERAAAGARRAPSAVPHIGEVRAAAGFQVVATQNPVEYVATGHLSEALRDRFEHLALRYQPAAEEGAIVGAETGCDDEALVRTAVRLARATRLHPRFRKGASVRGAIATVAIAEQLWSAGRGRLRPREPRDPAPRGRGRADDARRPARRHRRRLRHGARRALRAGRRPRRRPGRRSGPAAVSPKA